MREISPPPTEYGYEEINLMDYLNVLWKRKWLIIIPALLCAIAAGVYSFLLPPVWEVDAFILSSKLFIQTEGGKFEEIVVVDPKQIAGQINQKFYDTLIAAELNLDLREFPKLKAENLRDTKLVRIVIREKDVDKAKSILNSLFNHLKRDLDRKIDVEIKGIDTQVAAKETAIKQNELGIKDLENQILFKRLQIKDKENEIKKKYNDIHLKEMDVQAKEIDKNRFKKEIESNQNKLKISEERMQSIHEEMKSVKKRIDDLEEQLKKALAERKQGSDAVGLLLYSNEVQQNLRYYNTLDEKLSLEKITQENLNLAIRDKEEQLKQIDTQISQINTQKETIKAEIAIIKTEMEKINNEIMTIKNDFEKVRNNIATLQTEISFLNERKGRLDYAQLVKEPTPSLYPVSPKKRVNVLIALIIGGMMFTFLAFFLEYIEKQKAKAA